MDSARWHHVEEIFAAALDLPAERRDAFLTEACEGDEDLRREIESLLGHHTEGGFLVTGGVVHATRLHEVYEASAGESLGCRSADRLRR